jgi:hypothetical protein
LDEEAPPETPPAPERPGEDLILKKALEVAIQGVPAAKPPQR